MAEMIQGCAVCGIRRKLVRHHTLHEQVIRREGGNVRDPRVFLALCWTCHTRYHARQIRIHMSDLRDENYEFAAEVLGPGPAFEWLRRFYKDDGDPRLAALLNAERNPEDG